MSAWNPIETCPIKPFNQDDWFKPASDRVLLWNGFYEVIGSYGYTSRGKGRWQDWHGITNPTHWMPLPGAPEAA